MKKFLIILLFPFLVSSQTITQRWNQLTPDQKDNLDHTFDFYSRMAFVWGSSEILYHYTGDRLTSGAIGTGIGLASIFLERGVYGKAVSAGGSITGAFAFIIRWDIKDRRYSDYYEKRRSIESIKEKFDNL